MYQHFNCTDIHFKQRCQHQSCFTSHLQRKQLETIVFCFVVNFVNIKRCIDLKADNVVCENNILLSESLMIGII